jgi:hypothetical protein
MKLIRTYRNLQRFGVSLTAGCTLLQTGGCAIDQSQLINQIINLTIQTFLNAFLGAGLA